ncbi:ubiquitin-like-specific protease ESD4 [Apium graveolens]|uniref:ubiquitin-like-specific protease ESD4 n=1 Tax=Apium graveolens TaxID=4045 RepID=UPI003D79706E
MWRQLEKDIRTTRGQRDTSSHEQRPDVHLPKTINGRDEKDRRCDLTRPIKNQKIDWIFTHWWAGDLPYVFERHTDITMFLSKKQVQTLAPGNELEDDVVNAYMELVRLQERYMWQNGDLYFPAKRFFIAPSFLMYQSKRLSTNLNMDPYKKTGAELADQINFFKTYHRQFQGADIQLCDYSLFPTCTGGHWILFIVDLNKMKVLLVDPLREDGPSEKVLPCWLNYLDPQRFRKKFMKMAIVTARPKQDTRVDCGVYVCKYVDAILNGIRLEHAVWHPYDDVETFCYRITWELRRGRARHLSAWGLTQKNLGL